MNCSQARDQMTASADLGSLVNTDWEFQTHLRVCEPCGHYFSDRLLEEKLSALVIPNPGIDFVDRAIGKAIEANRVDRRRLFSGPALAAMLLLGLFLGLVLNNRFAVNTSPTVTHPPIALWLNQVKPVNVVIDSSDSVEDATISIVLAENIELEGYPGTREMSWKTPLLKGKNLLTLPLIMQNGSEGYMDVSYSAGNKVYKTRVPVNAGLEPPVTGPSI
jgi:hypothetical protein